MGSYLYLVAERQKKKKEETRKLRGKLLLDVSRALTELSRSISFTGAYIFGSITCEERFSPDSDVDIAFYGLRNEDFFKAISFLSRRLERGVDVIQLEGHRLEEKITREGISWTG